MRSAALVLALVSIGSFATGCRGADSGIAEAAPTGGVASEGVFTGTVAETMKALGYTYVRLQAPGQDDVWVAAPEFDAAAGQRLSVALEMPMRNFDSRTLNRRFDLVYFVQSVSRDGKVVAGGTRAAAPAVQMMTSRTPGTPSAPAGPSGAPPGVRRIADLWDGRKELSGREVVVRGRVVKVNNGILDTNWIHLQDGSGSEADRTNDITVTTDAVVRVGEELTVRGVLVTGKDFGSGYTYEVLVQDAVVVR